MLILNTINTLIIELNIEFIYNIKKCCIFNDILVRQHAKKPTHKKAHLVFCRHANPKRKNQKNLFWAFARKKQNNENKMTTRQNPEISTPKNTHYESNN